MFLLRVMQKCPLRYVIFFLSKVMPVMSTARYKLSRNKFDKVRSSSNQLSTMPAILHTTDFRSKEKNRNVMYTGVEYADLRQQQSMTIIPPKYRLPFIY